MVPPSRTSISITYDNEFFRAVCPVLVALSLAKHNFVSDSGAGGDVLSSGQSSGTAYRPRCLL